MAMNTRSGTAGMLKRVLLSVSFALLLCGQAQAQIFVVRHAEKAQPTADDPKNPPLSELGLERARALARALRDAGVTSVYATEFLRTRQTAQPTADAAQAQVTVVAGKEVEALATRLRDAKGSTLVVGHSDTVPALIKALGVKEEVAIGDGDYDNLFVVLTEPEPRLLRLHY